MKTTFRLLSFILILFPLQSRAKEVDLSASAEKKKAVISGVLSPASLSFNGQEIEQSSQSYEGLLINDREVKINEVSGLKTFFEEVEASNIELKWKQSDGKTKSVLKVEYPAVEQILFKDNKLFFRFNDVTEKVLFDSQPVDPKNPEVEIRSVHAWTNEVHTLELSTKQNTGQIYNLNFKNFSKEILIDHSAQVMMADSAFSGNKRPTALAVSYREKNENNWSLEGLAAYAKTQYDVGPVTSGSSLVTQQAVEFKGRVGWDPFTTDSGTIDYKRVTLGVFSEVVGYQRQSDFQMDWDNNGNSTTTVDRTFFQGGWFLRWEPLIYRNFGFVLNFDIRVFRTERVSMTDGDQKYLGLSYHF